MLDERRFHPLKRWDARVETLEETRLKAFIKGTRGRIDKLSRDDGLLRLHAGGDSW